MIKQTFEEWGPMMIVNWRFAAVSCFLLALSVSTAPVVAQKNGPDQSTSQKMAPDERDPLIRTARDLLDPKRSLPPSDHGLSTELDRTVKTIDGIVDRQNSTGWEETTAKFETAFKNMDDAATKIKASDCKSASVEVLVRQYNNSVNDLQIALSQVYNNLPQENISKLALPFINPNSSNYCDEMQKNIIQISSDREHIASEYLKTLNDNQKIYETFQSDYTDLLPQLKDHQGKLEKALNVLSERSAKDTITGNVPIILSIIAAACLESFFGLWIFDSKLQMEWVASGQIIQFMTVMILLSVIMALGLATILKETTLGTLLGGVAGYVLAQGVGRQAARDASRTAAPPPPAAPAPAPPPAPPPPPALPA